jgi:hypothetical protein
MMMVTRKSMMSGEVRTLNLDVTNQQLQRWRAGELIQNVMPKLTPSEREFIITGVTDEEWEDSMREEDDDHDIDTGIYDDGQYDDDPNPYHGTYSEE